MKVVYGVCRLRARVRLKTLSSLLKTKSNPDLVARIVPCSVPATYHCFEF